MIIPKEIREKIEQHLQLRAEIKDFLENNVDMEGFDMETLKIVDEPTGEEQTDDGEYCNQVTVYEDWYRGTYYWKCENGKYLAMDYEM